LTPDGGTGKIIRTQTIWERRYTAMGAYRRPTQLSDALAALSERPFTVLAGGTDFYPARVGRVIDEDVLDVTAVAELAGIAEAADHWRIGAATCWSDLIDHDLPPLFDGLKLAAREIGGAQIQNSGTLGGNLCNASPAADGVPPLLALEAAVELQGKDGLMLLPLDRFILGPRRTALRQNQLLAAIRVPKPPHPARSHFLKLGARKYLVISIAMVAATLEVEGGRVFAARVAIGACSPIACRLPALEAKLVGQPLTNGLGAIAEAEDLATLRPIDDVRGTAAYRNDAALTLVRRTLEALA
jgi:CO/xanthine dehydrogenase FAD-binding subunit